jgi:hypothetical protein
MAEQNKHKQTNTLKKKVKRRNILCIWRLDINTLEYLEKYKSTTDAVKWIKIHNLSKRKNHKKIAEMLSKVSNGIHKSAYGYKWKYDKDFSEIENEIWKELSFDIFKVSSHFTSF